VKFPSPIEVDITTLVTGDEIICQGEVYGTVEIECSRCLDTFDLQVSTRMQFIVKMLDSSVGLDNGESDDDFEVIPKTQTVFDISQRIKDAIVLNLPVKPLCGDECRGLCPMCGVNLNESECECTPDKADERWDALKDIFDEEVE